MTWGEGARVDAHLHIWDLARSAYGWLTPDLGDLYATFTPDQARQEMDACGIGRAVLVQAEDSVRDTELMLEAAAAHPWVAGVVGWIQLDDPGTAAAQLARWTEHRVFRGVRHLLHNDPREDLLARPVVRATLRLVAGHGLALDVPDAWPRHLGATAELAAALPNLRVVVDHLGKPPFGRPDWPAWRSALAEVASRPNTVAKVSGLQVPEVAFTVNQVRPAWEAALELFGPARLMWGSDWPMTVPSPGYAGAWQVMSGLVGELSAGEQELLLAGTATRVYRLPPAPPVAAAPG